MDKKNILITGASRGIGYETVKHLLAIPQNKVFVLSRNTQPLEELQKIVGTERLKVLAFDLTDFDQQKLLNFIHPAQQLDVVINNAGLLKKAPFEELTLENWRALFEVNVFGVVQLLQTLFPFLQQSKLAHVINIGSMGGVQGSSKFPGLAAYSAAKASLANLTECVAEEWKEENIRVNCLALGAVQTEMLATAFPGYEPPTTARQMGNYLSWFALNGHHFYNGKILPVAITTP